MHQVSKDLQLFVACLMFWCRHSTPKLSILHLNSIIVCALFLNAQRELDVRKKNKISDGGSDGSNSELVDENGNCSVDILRGCEKCSTEYLKTLSLKCKKYYESPVFNKKKNVFEPHIVKTQTVYEPHTLHMFAQLQACMLDGLGLNKVLCGPVPDFQPARLYNGTLVYNMYTELESRTKPDLFLELLLEKDSPLHKVIIKSIFGPFLNFKIFQIKFFWGPFFFIV